MEGRGVKVRGQGSWGCDQVSEFMGGVCLEIEL